MTNLEELYCETLLTLVKAIGNNPPRKFIRSLNDIHDKTEVKTLQVVHKIIKRARVRFLKKFKVESLNLETIHKSNEDNIKSELEQIMQTAFAGASDELVAVLEDHIDELAKNFATMYNVKIDYKLVSKKAVEYLEEAQENYFSTLSDDAAAGIQRSIAAAMASDEQYSMRDIVSNIRNTWGKSTIDLSTKTLDVDYWAKLVATSSTAKASSYSTRATLESLDLKYWQWNCNADPCDDCDANDEQIVAIGDAFNSGDTEPSLHPLCRCAVIAVTEEITSNDYEPPDSED